MSFHTTYYLLILLINYLFCYYLIYNNKNNTYLSVPPIIEYGITLEILPTKHNIKVTDNAIVALAKK